MIKKNRLVIIALMSLVGGTLGLTATSYNGVWLLGLILLGASLAYLIKIDGETN